MLSDVEYPIVFGNSGVGVAGCHDVVLENGRKLAGVFLLLLASRKRAIWE